jgi:hypothetical protein
VAAARNTSVESPPIIPSPDTRLAALMVPLRNLCSNEEFAACEHEAQGVLEKEGYRAARKYVVLIVETFRSKLREESELADDKETEQE